MRFDIFIIILALFNCISLPLEVSFTELTILQTNGYQIFSRFTDVLFAIDIIVNLRTTYISEQTGMEIVEQRSIFIHYACSGRFVVDFLASIPFDLLIPANEGNQSSQTALLGALKLVRLLRLGRIVQFMKMRQDLKLGFKIF